MTILAGGITTFISGRRGPDFDAVAATLHANSFTLGTPDRIRLTVLDTFDGRVADAGLRLELTAPAEGRRRSPAGDLVLRAEASAPAQVVVSGRPRVATDVPAGPFRFRLAQLLDVRVLLPLLTVETVRTVATKRNGAGKTTAVAVVYGSPVVDDVALDDPLVEVVELSGYPKPADDLRAALTALGMGVIAGGVADLAAGTIGVDLAGQSITPGMPLPADTPALEGFRTVLDNLGQAIVLNWAGTVADLDPEFLHDLRVAVRRTRSVLANAKNVIPADIRDRARDDFGWLGQITGPARDLDVYQIEWPAYTDQLADDTLVALETLRARLEGERQAAHRLLAEELSAAPARRIIDGWMAWLDTPLGGTDAPGHADRPIGELITKRIRRAHRTMIERGRTITPESPAQVLHELRKDAKKLRYLLECFGGLYRPAARKAFVQRLKSLQDNLGEHQDAEVHVQHLRELSDVLAASWMGSSAPGSATETMVATGQLIERMDQRRIASRNEFAERFAAFDSAKTDDALAVLLASTSDGGP